MVVLAALLCTGCRGAKKAATAPLATDGGATAAAPATGPAGDARTTIISVVHFSDYHSHAVPFFSQHRQSQGGLARAIGVVRRLRQSGRAVLVVSGGDMLNSGAPAWSEKYRCADWPLWNGLLDAMALGNHDLDYGFPALSACRTGLRYPVLSANLLSADGTPLLQWDGKPYLVKEIAGVRLGVFALAGADFGALVKPERLPAGARFADPLATARAIVRRLREEERVSAVLAIGHQDRESDLRMAQEVPGIDVIFGSHSHYLGPFQIIPGTRTGFISPHQYLTHLARVELTFARDPGAPPALRGVSGALQPLDDRVAPDPDVAQQLERMQRELESDPTYAPRFATIGQATVELSDDGVDRGESVLGNFVLDRVRAAGQGQVALSSAGSFRASIAPGPIRLEDYLLAVPYPNRLWRLRLRGSDLIDVLNYSAAHRGSDQFLASAGVRYGIKGQEIVFPTILVASSEGQRYEPVDPLRVYDVVTTDFLINVAPGYRERFARARGKVDTGKTVTDVVLEQLRRAPASAALEGRVYDVVPR